MKHAQQYIQEHCPDWILHEGHVYIRTDQAQEAVRAAIRHTESFHRYLARALRNATPSPSPMTP